MDPVSRVNLIRKMRAEGYRDLRFLRDGKLVGVIEMNFSWRTCVNLDEDGHGGGVDFATYEEAAHFANTMQRIDDWPPAGWLADKRAVRPGTEHPDSLEEFLYAKE